SARTATATATPARTATASATPASNTAVLRINAGGEQQTVGGAIWAACTASSCNGYVSGGSAYRENDSNTGVPQNMNNAIFQTEWTGGTTQGIAAGNTAFSFALPLANGSYTVKLYFVELNKFAAGRRIFDVAAEGNTVLDDYDIYVRAGGANKVVVETFTIATNDGTLNLDFITGVENAKISAIEVLR
ncbi:hypothetical protein HC891_08410, partial [Candidatus Gracilibacteria bacterium]|nr:hypothetical protein [Candidatus Gracilibacteria bacterium]